MNLKLSKSMQRKNCMDDKFEKSTNFEPFYIKNGKY